MWGDRQTDLEMAWVDPSYARREIPLIATHLTTCSTLLLDRICAANPREFLIEGCLECQSQIQMNRYLFLPAQYYQSFVTESWSGTN